MKKKEDLFILGGTYRFHNPGQVIPYERQMNWIMPLAVIPKQNAPTVK